jgi:hypothetical protein
VHGEHVRRGLVRRDVDSPRGHEREVIEGPDPGGGRRHCERQIAHSFKQEVATDTDFDAEGLPDDVVHRHVGEPHACRSPEDEKDPLAPPEGSQPFDEMGGSPRRARVPARRKPFGYPPDEPLRALVVARSESDEEDADRGSRREADAGVEDGPTLADQQRSEEDPDRQDDSVQEALGKERPSCDEGGHILLPQGLDPQQVAPASGEEVVRATAD